MARPTKEYKTISMKLSLPIFERLDDYCKETSTTKTGLVEKAITEYLDKCDKEREFLEKHMK